MLKRLTMFVSLLLTGCTGAPRGIEPVRGFVLDRYLGKWYEIARLDHSFEKGLANVTAEYTFRGNGGVGVTNRGYDSRKHRWREAKGKASFVGSTDIGYLKVSFFGPFYGSYIVVDLDREQYQWAMVCGPDRSYLWILCRQPDMAIEQRNAMVARAKELGFDTSRLIYVEQSQPG